MADTRKQRQQRRDSNRQPGVPMRNIVIAVVIVAVCAGLYYFLRRKHDSRMDAFAQCLSTKGAKMYGAYWCPHCADQKEMFGSSFQYAPYVECGIKGSRNQAQVCIDAGVKRFPTWVFADGARVEGAHSLEFLGQETGCPLP
ncbi:MAG: hypothetical protein WBQ09_06810 [Terriglobales bacterium]|jgi:hypothetical protein